MIYHIAEEETWKTAQTIGRYYTASLVDEGFVHCSTRNQVEATANRYFSHRVSILVLTINPSLLDVELKLEISTGGERYPHIYGSIPVSAVVSTVVVPRSEDGTYRLATL